MVKRCIGIDVGFSHLCAVQVLRIGKAFCIERIFETQARRDTDSASQTLRELVSKHGFDRRAAVAISVPNDAVFFRSVGTDAEGLEQVRGADYSIFDHAFPMEADEMVIQPCSYRRVADQEYSILTAAVAKESVRQTRDIVAGARMRPGLIGTTVFSVHSAIALNHPEIRTGVAIIAHMAEPSLTLAVTENNRILAVRHFPITGDPESNGNSGDDDVAEVISREACITWRKLFETEIAQDTRVFLAGAGENAADIRESVEENLHCQTIVVNPYARLLLKHVGRPSVDISVAEGLALKMLVPEHTSGINLLEADAVSAGSATTLKRDLAICLVLVAAIAAVSVIGLFMKRSRLESKYAALRSEIKGTFKSVLPDEMNIVEPVAQVEQRLQSLRKDYAAFGLVSGAGPLEILNVITGSTPEGMNINLNGIEMTAESVQLTGTTESFGSVTKWQRLLEAVPQFSTVDTGDPERPAPGEPVHFVVVASFAKRNQE